MLICKALEWAKSQGIDSSDRQLLLLHCMGQKAHNKAYLRAHDQDPLSAPQLRHYELLINKCQKGEPVAYLIGEREFYGLSFKVTPATLIPRPDTETLVDWALECAKSPSAKEGGDAPGLHKGAHRGPLKILDLGTGSGCIAIALKRQLPSAEVWATDISPDALSVARENAERNQTPIEFRLGSWFEALGDASGAAVASNVSNVANPCHDGFDLIVSNPPYIAEHDPHLVNLQFEPYGALVGGTTGLEVYRELLLNAPHFLYPGGRILFEHGYNQAEEVKALFESLGFESVQSRTDLAGICRCTGGIRPKNGIIGT